MNAYIHDVYSMHAIGTQGMREMASSAACVSKDRLAVLHIMHTCIIRVQIMTYTWLKYT